RAPSFPRGRAGLAATPFDVEGIGARFASYVRDESAAAFSHMRALGSAKTPADLIRLQVSEMQRAADASLTCWSDIARKASRLVEFR
ncbi:phasin family protein, partial [Methylobacterium trifolii]